MNPGGSMKDRMTMNMVQHAEERGELKPGGTIVEATSGNTGAGLAMIAAVRGYQCVFVMPDKMSHEKIAALRAWGARVVVCPTAVEPEDPRSYYSGRQAHRAGDSELLLLEPVPQPGQPGRALRLDRPRDLGRHRRSNRRVRRRSRHRRHDGRRGPLLEGAQARSAAGGRRSDRLALLRLHQDPARDQAVHLQGRRHRRGFLPVDLRSSTARRRRARRRQRVLPDDA